MSWRRTSQGKTRQWECPESASRVAFRELQLLSQVVENYARDYLVGRFGGQIAEDIKPLEIQKWMKSLNETNGLAWMTIAKLRGFLFRIYKIGQRHELVAKNPVLLVETFKVRLPGLHQYPGTDACDPETETWFWIRGRLADFPLLNPCGPFE